MFAFVDFELQCIAAIKLPQELESNRGTQSAVLTAIATEFKSVIMASPSFSMESGESCKFLITNISEP